MGKKKDQPFNNPFASVGEDLKKRVRAAQKEEEQKREQERLARIREERAKKEPEVSFARAVEGAVPLKDDGRGVVRPPLPPDHADDLAFYDEDAEALAELMGLVDGTTKFDIADSDEFISGCVEGLDRRVLGKLKRGDFAYSAHLDLHGMTRDVARDAVERFVTEERRKGHRCVLIVHGRGLNSKDKIPVLKGLLKSWLERGRIARSTLAFCTARPHDGGQGAVYVLLRR